MPDDDNLPRIPDPGPDDDTKQIVRDLKHAKEQQKIADSYPGRRPRTPRDTLPKRGRLVHFNRLEK